MPRPPKTSIRKRDLIEATMRAIHKGGAAEPTMAEISSSAGLASGSIINHYFSSKEELMQETYRELAGTFSKEVALRVKAVNSPVEKLEAVVTAVFAPSQTTPEAITGWLWYWSRAALDPVYGEIERTAYREVRNELAAALRRLLPRQQVADAAEGILALMYGLWLRFALDPSGLDSERAIRITMDVVRTQLGLESANGSEKAAAVRKSRSTPHAGFGKRAA